MALKKFLIQNKMFTSIGKIPLPDVSLEKCLQSKMNEMLHASKEPRVQQRDATERMQRPCDRNSREPSPRVTGDTEDQVTNSTLEMHTWAQTEAHQTRALRKGDGTGEGRRS